MKNLFCYSLTQIPCHDESKIIEVIIRNNLFRVSRCDLRYHVSYISVMPSYPIRMRRLLYGLDVSLPYCIIIRRASVCSSAQVLFSESGSSGLVYDHQLQQAEVRECPHFFFVSIVSSPSTQIHVCCQEKRRPMVTPLRPAWNKLEHLFMARRRRLAASDGQSV
jgi:hypothetical protein